MNPPLVVSERAANDVRRAMDFIARDSVDSAIRFHEAVCRTFQLTTENPGAGSEVEGVPARLRGLRKWPVHEFLKYAVYYSPTRGSVEIVRVLHGARNIHRLLDDER